ncbi:YwgA family protein [Thermoanaerobacter pentosaceus]|jgi:hypothetical protein|uniref:Uncharacterized protein YwgA n=1 Tax=Thermoanaerobacter pentosaceus TaxID=694059 RepID=A0ABT9M5T0_9THEO|nr:hypothetical protein [Thermoanaerobacter pentosaceus]MDP9751432.1 uncharacterized protein YwgA [Thermoanaerobacter pentosaceus]
MSNFLENYANIIELLRIAGKIEGRKKLQKMVYILKNLGADFKEDFYFHYYGPYSDVLTIELEELKSMNVIKENVKEHDSYFPTYTYEINIDDIGVRGDLEDYKELIGKLNRENSRFLELIATIMYFKKERKYEKEDIIKKIKIVKSEKNYTDEEIKKAFDFLETISDLDKGILST